MTRILRLVWHRSEPDPEFDESLDRALSRAQDQNERLDLLRQRLDIYERRR